MENSIILFGFGKPVIELYKSLQSKFLIHGLYVDYHRSKKMHADFYNSVSDLNIKLLSEEETVKINSDIILVINFNKIINTMNYKDKIVINIHMGILPKYRGNNANAWAILNGEGEVGYSVHSVSEELDAGDIYFTYKCKIDEGGTYNDSKELIDQHLFNNISSKIQSIINGNITPYSQDGEEFIYCSKLLHEDGLIKNWDVPADSLIRMFQVFSEPRGTGLWFIHNNKEYCITAISRIKRFANSPIGFCGAVVNKTRFNSIWVKVRDTAVEISAIKDKFGVTIKPTDIVKIGQRL